MYQIIDMPVLLRRREVTRGWVFWWVELLAREGRSCSLVVRLEQGRVQSMSTSNYLKQSILDGACEIL